MRNKNGQHIWWSNYGKYETAVVDDITMMNSSMKKDRHERP